MSIEQWKDISGYENLYQVSSRGNVKSILRGILLKPYVGGPNRDYLYVTLYRDKLPKKYRVHILVAKAFIGDRSNEGLVVLHGPGGSQDNSAANLRWGTQSENIKDQVDAGTHRQARKTDCPRMHPLIEPNLVQADLRRGIRSCKACANAKSHIRKHGGDLQQVSDTYFRKIMA